MTSWEKELRKLESLEDALIIIISKLPHQFQRKTVNVICRHLRRELKND